MRSKEKKPLKEEPANVTSSHLAGVGDGTTVVKKKKKVQSFSQFLRRKPTKS